MAHSNDAILLPPERYFDFMQNWLKYFYSYSLEASTKQFFKGISVLMDNQIMIAYCNTLTQNEIY